MKRRSRAGGEAIKGRRKALRTKHGDASKTVSSSPRSQDVEVARLTRELNEAREQQTATSEVLQVIGSSPGELEPVFSAMLENAVRICDATFGNIYRWDGKALHLIATLNTPPAFAEARMRSPFRPDSKSFSGRMLTSKTVIHRADLAAEETYLERHDTATVAAVELGGVRTFLLVPILKENELIGSFNLFRRDVRPFTDKQIELVKNFATQAVIAIENARLLNELRQRTTDLTEALEQQTATSEVLQVISRSPGELQPVFDAMLAKAVRICDAKFGNIHLWDGDALHLVASHNFPPAFAEARRRVSNRPNPKSSLGRMMATKAVVHVADAAEEPGYAKERDPGAVVAVELGGVRTALYVPLLKENELLGDFTLSRQEVRPFTDKEISLVQNFAAQAVIAIENTRLLNELRESLQQQTATADVLKVISRSAFDLPTVLNTLVESAARLCKADKAQILVPSENVHCRYTWRAARIRRISEKGACRYSGAGKCDGSGRQPPRSGSNRRHKPSPDPRHEHARRHDQTCEGPQSGGGANDQGRRIDRYYRRLSTGGAAI
jgi:GAF domain-containing protein